MAQRNTGTGPLWTAYQELRAGRLSRRAFIQRATALGVALPVTTAILNAVNGAGVSAQGSPATRPSAPDDQQRGAGGELKILQWQAATHMSVHTAIGTKDALAASLVSEPLMSYLPDATLIPTLVKEVPSVENGLLAEDLTSVTFNLLEGVLWSDGEPFTAQDVVFTVEWIKHEPNGSNSINNLVAVENVEAIDDLTVRVTYRSPQLAWYFPFTGTFFGSIYPAHVWGGDPTDPDPINDFRQGPIGTGPYKVESFAENDQIIYVVNEHYREPNKPYFERVNLKGGGDAVAAARAVLQTGDWHFAWNLQIEPAILEQLAEAGKGQVIVAPGTNVERVLFNFSNPREEFEGERAHWQNPHPFLTDKAVRQALSLAADRELIAQQFYGEGEPAAVNIVTGIPAIESPNTTWEYNLDKARQALDEAGWVLDGDVRVKDGVELSVTYSTSINAVRQKTQAVNKQNWEAIGVKVQLKQVDAGVFFDSAAGNEQNSQHFYEDLLMYTNGAGSPLPLTYMQWWYSNDGQAISQSANGWSQNNESRYNNPEYDVLYEAAAVETDPERVADLYIQMNDIVINDVVIIPLVQRAAEKYGIANALRQENVAASAWEALYWNIGNWTAVS
ncbi:MAG: peptide ABC transporter substrate-binding protein [Thermomicrobiales bacterium]